MAPDMKLKSTFNFYLSMAAICMFLTSCAGPTTPFGGEVLISQDFSVDKNQANYTWPKVHIGSTPDRQYYNSPYDLKLSIYDPGFDLKKFRYEIIYNNKILNRWFKSEEITFPKKKSDPIVINFKNLSILPGNINKISFLYYPIGSLSPVIHKLKVPECHHNGQDKVVPKHFKISRFNVTPELESNIKELAKLYGYNSSMVAALIAQESSFNPNAISFAKALGLTQVTPMAHTEILKYRPHWKIYPRFSNLPFLNLKSKVITREINSKNDWRLDEKKSIEGGILYLNYLNQYWKTTEKVNILADVFDMDIPKTDILLASYNSGAFRVKKSILKNRKDWLFDDSLHEARKYVMNIKSYCYSFHGGNRKK
jgi:hypothetical protein